MKNFKSQIPLHKIPIGLKQWRYYDFGPKAVPPLICLPGTADVYYKQIMSLSLKGYRIISLDIPPSPTITIGFFLFEKFLDAIDVHHIHLYGTSLGGFLAQLFAHHRPRRGRVRSLLLCNSFLDTTSFAAAMPWSPLVVRAPSFLLKRYVLTGIRDGPHEPFIADSVDFVVSQVEALSREDLASRLTLTVDAALIGPLILSDEFITIMDVWDASTGIKIYTCNDQKSAVFSILPSSEGDFSFQVPRTEASKHHILKTMGDLATTSKKRI